MQLSCQPEQGWDISKKHFPPAHHTTVRPSYLHVAKYGKPSTMQGCVNLTLSANHPVHPCAPDKGSAHAYTQNCARIHRESLEDAHARAQQRTHLYNYFLTCLNNDSETQNQKIV